VVGLICPRPVASRPDRSNRVKSDLVTSDPDQSIQVKNKPWVYRLGFCFVRRARIVRRYALVMSSQDTSFLLGSFRRISDQVYSCQSNSSLERPLDLINLGVCHVSIVEFRTTPAQPYRDCSCHIASCHHLPRHQNPGSKQSGVCLMISRS
jgi:hypothetical protein